MSDVTLLCINASDIFDKAARQMAKAKGKRIHFDKNH